MILDLIPIIRQWPKVYDLCHTLLHILCFKCNTRMSMRFLTSIACKNKLQNLIPLATAYLSCLMLRNEILNLGI